MLSSILPVHGLIREYPADAASRIGHAALVTWDKMNMQMKNGLTCRKAVIDADIEAVRR